jgi:hypothetical protein
MMAGDPFSEEATRSTVTDSETYQTLSSDLWRCRTHLAISRVREVCDASALDPGLSSSEI